MFVGLCAAAAALVLQDGRAARVMRDDAAIARFIQSRVVELANAAIASKGAFSMSIGSGTTVAPLIELAGEVDFTRVHLFFGNERTEGEAAGKREHTVENGYNCMVLPCFEYLNILETVLLY